MVCIRKAMADDLLAMQACNTLCMQETQQMKIYSFHILSWPQIQYVAEDYNGKIVGYVMVRMEAETTDCYGVISALAVLRTHQKRGLRAKLITAAQNAMEQVYGAEYVTLYVRTTSMKAFHLYPGTLGFTIHKLKKNYYTNGDDAYEMRKPLKGKRHHHMDENTDGQHGSAAVDKTES